MRSFLRRHLRRKCNGRTYHVWSEDPMVPKSGALFHRVDCVYCDYALDAVALQNLVKRLNLGDLPGRIADPDELEAWRARRDSSMRRLLYTPTDRTDLCA